MITRSPSALTTGCRRLRRCWSGAWRVALVTATAAGACLAAWLVLERLVESRASFASAGLPWLIAATLLGGLILSGGRPVHRFRQAASVSEQRTSVALSGPDPEVAFELRRSESGDLIRTYVREGAALGFIRDIVFLRGHREAAGFELLMVHPGATATTIAEGDGLVRRALEDRVL